MKLWALVILAIFHIAGGASSAAASEPKRLAFLVGIDTYANLSGGQQLEKAVGDVASIGEAFRALSFEVNVAENPTRFAFNQAWQEFIDKISPGDLVAFAFSGHGVEIGGANYLLPSDVPKVRSGREELLRRESISFQELMADLRERKPRLSVLILDACRENPFAEPGTRSVGAPKGLARVEPPEGTFVMFSAGAGQTALDRLDDNDKFPTSVYMRNLVPLLTAPGLSILDVADRVGEQVRDLAATVQHRQTPVFYAGIVGGRGFCLAGCGAPSPERSASPLSTNGDAALSWLVVKDSEDVEIVEAFRKQYGAANALYDRLAANLIEKIKRNGESSTPVVVPEGVPKFRWPLKGKVVAKFGPRVDGTHNDGVDIETPLNTNVHATLGGTIAYAGSELKGYGNLVLVRHEGGWISAYAHNSKLLVKRGDEVRQGQVIAKSGSSGAAARPQLHFEIRSNTNPVDPVPLLGKDQK